VKHLFRQKTVVSIALRRNTIVVCRIIDLKQKHGLLNPDYNPIWWIVSDNQKPKSDFFCSVNPVFFQSNPKNELFNKWIKISMCIMLQPRAPTLKLCYFLSKLKKKINEQKGGGVELNSNQILI